MMKKAIYSLALPALLACSSTQAAEQAPGHSITLVVPHAAGTGVDGVARGFAPALEKALGTAIVVENRAGANGAIGSMAVARAAPDGHTLMLNANPPFITYPLTQKKPLYNPLQDFTPIARVGTVPMVLVVSASSGIKNFAQFEQYIKNHPDKANYASPGSGSAGYLAMERLKTSQGIKIVEVLYKSTPQSLIDVSAGNVLAAFASVPAAVPLLQAGKLRPLAVGSAVRVAQLPEVPTLIEATGQKDFLAVVWYGFFAPAKLPAPTLAKLYAAMKQAFEAPSTQQAMTNLSIVPELQSPQAFRQTYEQDVSNAQKIMKATYH